MVDHISVLLHIYPLFWRGIGEGLIFIGLAVVLMLFFGRPVPRA